MHKRAEIVGVGLPFQLVTSPVPQPSSDSVRLKVAYAGVCHSDVHLTEDVWGISKSLGADKFKGMVLGHEISGYIDEAGEDVDLAKLGLKIGDSVMVYPWVGCQDCSRCKAGYSNLCTDPSVSGIGCGPFAHGGFQTHMVTKPQYLVKVPDSIPMEVACLLPCGAGTSYSALLKLNEALDFAMLTQSKARLLIIGSGGLGLWAMQLAKAIHGDKVHVVAADIDQSKLDLTKTFGADETVLWDPSASVEANAEATMNNGPVNGVLDFCATVVTSQTAAKCVMLHGAIVFVGLHGGTFSDDFQHIVFGSLTVRGSRTFSRGQLNDLVSLVMQHKLAYPSLTFYKLAEVYDVIQQLKHGKINGRAIINPHL